MGFQEVYGEHETMRLGSKTFFVSAILTAWLATQRVFMGFLQGLRVEKLWRLRLSVSRELLV